MKMSSQRWPLLFLLSAGVANGQFGCGWTTPSPLRPLLPCPPPMFPPMPPIPPPLPPMPPSPPSCPGCPIRPQLPELIPLPKVFPETPPGEGKDLNESRPIVPDVSPNWVYGNRPPMPPSPGCGFPTLPPLPTFPPLPTLPPLPPLPTLPPPAPLPLFLPLQSCCGRCIQCPLPPSPQSVPLPPATQMSPPMPPQSLPKKAFAAKTFRHRDDPRSGSLRCTSDQLRLILEKHRQAAIAEAKLPIQREAEQIGNGLWHTFCSAGDLEYVVRTESFCTAELADGICYVFRTN